MASRSAQGAAGCVMVPEVGVEPTRPCGHGILSPLRYKNNPIFLILRVLLRLWYIPRQASVNAFGSQSAAARNVLMSNTTCSFDAPSVLFVGFD